MTTDGGEWNEAIKVAADQVYTMRRLANEPLSKGILKLAEQKILALKRQSGEEMWRPIESAPQSGIVLLSDGEFFGTGYYNPVRWQIIGCLAFEWQAVLPADFKPTHWMPLPNPPAKRQSPGTLGDRQLEWLRQQKLPMWGGHLDRGEPITDGEMRQWVEDGIIRAVETPRRGYLLTEKGRAYVALKRQSGEG